MRENYTLTRLFIEADLSQDARIGLEKDHAHYLGTVLRKSSGDSVRVFNGRDGEWVGILTDIGRKGGELTLTQHVRVQHSVPDIQLYFAPVKKHRTQFIVEKATELGAAALCPVLTERTQFPKLNLDKMRLQAIEAAEQTERLDIPAIHPMPKGGLMAMLDAWPATRTLIFADEGGAARPAREVVATITAPAAILIGPEGGFTDKERDVLRAHASVIPVSLGPRILRADTAALSLLTLWQAAQGDWDTHLG